MTTVTSTRSFCLAFSPSKIIHPRFETTHIDRNIEICNPPKRRKIHRHHRRRRRRHHRCHLQLFQNPPSTSTTTQEKIVPLQPNTSNNEDLETQPSDRSSTEDMTMMRLNDFDGSGCSAVVHGTKVESFSTFRIGTSASMSTGNGKDTNGIHATTEVPRTMPEAIRVFFLSGDKGPLLVVLCIVGLIYWRLSMTMSISMTTTEIMTIAAGTSASIASTTTTPFALTPSDGLVAGLATIVWWFQEYFLHSVVLHSKMDWIGKRIHQDHHDKPYHHVSVDPAPLLLGWMVVAHVVLFRGWLPLPLAISATIGYTISGLIYEWAHYIVHTRVKLTNTFWIRVRDNHIRHHLVSDKFWFAFTMPVMDDLFQTNPSVRQINLHQQQ